MREVRQRVVFLEDQLPQTFPADVLNVIRFHHVHTISPFGVVSATKKFFNRMLLHTVHQMIKIAPI